MKKVYVLFLILSITQYAQNFWLQTNGPFGYEGATVNDFLLYKDSIIFIATQKGIIKSTSNGQTWNTINSSKIKCLAVDKFGVLYAGENYTSNNYFLLKSTDEGNSWDRMNIGYWPDIQKIVITYKDTIFLASLNLGVLRSTDSGSNWAQINNGLENISINSLIFLSNGHLLIGSNRGGVFKSTDLGNSWVSTNSGIPVYTSGYIYANSFCEIDSGKILVGAQDGIYYSTNYGDSWVLKSSGYSNGRPNCIIIDNNGNIYAGTSISGGVYWSSNAGNSWTYIGLGNTILSLGFDAESKLCAGALSEGLYKLSNTWDLIYQGDYLILETKIISLTESGIILAGTVDGGLYITTNQGQSWEKTNYDGGEINSIISINDSIIICGSYQNSNLYISYDIGNTWITKIGNVSALSYGPINSIVYWARGNEIYISNDFGQNWVLLESFSGPWIVIVVALHITNLNQYIFADVYFADHFGYWVVFYKSKDQGQTWSGMNVFSRILSIEENKLGTIYALGAAGWGGGLFITYDEGDNWISKSVSGLCLSSDIFQTLYLGTGDGIFYSYDEGTNWIRMYESGLEDTKINDIIINNDRIFVATRKGVHVSLGLVPVGLTSLIATYSNNSVNLNWSTATELNNRGFEIGRSINKTDWRLIGFKEGNGTTTETHNYSFVDDLFGLSSNKLYYRLKQIDFDGTFEYSDIVEVDIAPTEFSLSQNYPNPFNPSTKIKFQIPLLGGDKRGGFVTLKVYDILGSEVATLVNEEKNPGVYEVEFDASGIRNLPAGRQGLASGIYFYQLKTGKFIETKKMILMN